jgi:hypothetical protein
MNWNDARKPYRGTATIFIDSPHSSITSFDQPTKSQSVR